MKAMIKAKKGAMNQDKVIDIAIYVLLIATVAGAVWTLIENATTSVEFQAIPVIGSLGGSGLIGILFGISLLLGFLAVMRVKRSRSR